MRLTPDKIAVHAPGPIPPVRWAICASCRGKRSAYAIYGDSCFVCLRGDRPWTYTWSLGR